MSDMINSYIADLSAGFFIRQLAVILVLFLVGYITNVCLGRGKVSLLEVLLAFPVGISEYTILSFAMLMVGIPFNRISITCAMALIVGLCLVRMRTGKESLLGGHSKKEGLICLITVLCISVISTSGLISVSVSNDSLYYYSMYPRAIAEYGYFRSQFDVFLTDVGPTSAILNTLPFVYGFNEGFGLQTFLGINTTLAVAYAVYGQAVKKLDKKKAGIVTAILLMILLSTQPYIIMLKWMMSNGYFMCFIFLVVYAAYYYDDFADDKGQLILMGILFLQMSMLRMEGIMVALILLVCFIPFKYKNKDLLLAFMVPVFISALVFSAKVFLVLKVDAPYTFLTPKKAVLQLAAIAAVGMYLLVVRGKKWDLIGKHVKVVLPCALVFVNLVLFAYDRGLYLDNLKAFIGNVSNRSGWGLFPMFVIAAYVLVFTVDFKGIKNKPVMTYWDMCFLSYLLATLAVCFAREGALRENIGDSGNRVLMQVTLLAFMATACRLIGLVNRE